MSKSPYLKSEAFHYPVASPEKTLATGLLLHFSPVIED